MKISVVMTTYNGERFVKQQLDSVFRQTHQPDEVLIYDDHSADGTVSIIKGYISEKNLFNWKLFENNDNVGYIKNFYQAIHEATGDLIFLCDQDDIWHSDKIEKMIMLIQKNQGIHVLCSSFRKVDESGDDLKEKNKYGYSNNGLIKGYIKALGLKKISLARIIKANIAPGCTAVLTKECRELYLRCASMLWPHDWEIFIFGAILNGLYFYNEELVDYRIHANNTIGLNDEKRSLSIDKSHNERVRLAESEYERVSLYKDIECVGYIDRKMLKPIIRYYQFTEHRLKALSKFSLSLWIRLLISISFYTKAIGVRGVIGDLLYIIKYRGEGNYGQ